MTSECVPPINSEQKNGSIRRRRSRIVLVAACSQRKRAMTAEELRLSSIEAPADERAQEWRHRLAHVPAPRVAANEIYAGDHWRAVLEAYQLAGKYSTRAELWVISAGYGLIASTTRIKSYSATFAASAPDSVWRGPEDGDRRTRLQYWWRNLGHEASLEELLPSGGGALLIAAGAGYLAAIDGDIERLSTVAPSNGIVSVISAGTRGEGSLLPLSGALRSVVGGTDSALNARTLRLLAATAEEHHFRHSNMRAMLDRIARSATPTIRRSGSAATDGTIAKAIQSLRRQQPGISRTQALREVRSSGTACEQSRFAAIWASLAGDGE